MANKKAGGQKQKNPVSINATELIEELNFKLVRMGRLELPHLTALEPKSSVSTNSTTSAEDETYINSIYGNVNALM